MPQQQNNKCCLCKKTFDQNNFPRLMPSCDHSVCTNCLKNSFKNNLKQIVCLYCGNKQQIIQPDLQYFPKNIGLIKNLKENSNKKPSTTNEISTPIKSGLNPQSPKSQQFLNSFSGSKRTQQTNDDKFLPSDSSLISKKSNSSIEDNPKRQLCSVHNKQLQIICLTDFTKLCPLCAVFGVHKQHQLKTIDETSKILSEMYKQFETAKVKKKVLQTKIKNSQFKSQITQKINSARTTLSKQIKDKFTVLKQALATAQKNANQDLNKKFKQVYDKINNLVKQQCQFQAFFNDWMRTVEIQLAETNRIGCKFQEKAKIYLDGSLNTMKQGNFYLSQIQSYLDQKKYRVQTMPSLVTLQFGDSLIKDIYNYLTVKFDDYSGSNNSDVLLTSSRAGNQQSSLKNIPSNTMTPQMYSSTPSSGNKLSSNNSIQSNQGINSMTKKPIKVQFSSSQNFLSPNRDKIMSPSNINIPPKKSPRKKSKSVPKQQPTSSNNLLKSRLHSPAKKQSTNPSTIQISQQRKKYIQATSQQIVQQFIQDEHLQTLDLCQFSLLDQQIIQILDYINNKQKKIKCLKLVKNRLTNQGFLHMINYLKNTTNINLSGNSLTQDILLTLMKYRQKVSNLRILNLSSNKVNQRKAKTYVQELKKHGIIVTL